MKGFITLIMVCLVAAAGTVFSEQNTQAKPAKIPQIYGPDAQRLRQNASSARPQAQAAQSKPAMAQSRIASDQLSGNIGEIAQYSRELKLTEEQTQAFQDLMTQFQPAAAQLDGGIRICRIDISNALKKEKPDFEMVNEKLKTISDLQYEIRQAILTAYVKAYNLLTPDQKARYNELVNVKKEMTPPASSSAPEKDTADQDKPQKPVTEKE